MDTTTTDIAAEIVPAAAVQTCVVTRWTKWVDLPEWLTCREAAIVLNCKMPRLYASIREGRIPYRKAGPKLILIPKEYFHPSKATKQVTA